MGFPATSDKKTMETEKIMLAVIYKKDGYITIDFPNYALDVQSWEFYGFLTAYLKKLGDELADQIQDNRSDDED